MNEADAFQLEILLIYQYGRIDLGTGCLRNLTNGGDGVSGIIPWNKGKTGIYTAEQIQHLSDKSKAHIKTPEQSRNQSAGQLGKKRGKYKIDPKKFYGFKKGNIPWNKGLGKKKDTVA